MVKLLSGHGITEPRGMLLPYHGFRAVALNLPILTGASIILPDMIVGDVTAFDVSPAFDGATSYSAAGLPDGLSINNSTGVVSGTPTVAGSFSVSYSASNADGTRYGGAILLEIAPIPLAIGTVPALNYTAFTGVQEYTIPHTGSVTSWEIVSVVTDTAASITTSPNVIHVNSLTAPVRRTVTSPSPNTIRVE